MRNSGKFRGCALAYAPGLLAADAFQVEKIDPAAAGMSPDRLARIAPRMKEFVDSGKVA